MLPFHHQEWYQINHTWAGHDTSATGHLDLLFGLGLSARARTAVPLRCPPAQPAEGNQVCCSGHITHPAIKYQPSGFPVLAVGQSSWPTPAVGLLATPAVGQSRLPGPRPGHRRPTAAPADKQQLLHSSVPGDWPRAGCQQPTASPAQTEATNKAPRCGCLIGTQLLSLLLWAGTSQLFDYTLVILLLATLRLRWATSVRA